MEQTKKLKTSSDFFFFRPEKVVEVKKESVSCRNIQKADREKIRRDKLNEQTKSDKASILIDKIQTLKDLMTQVDRLKAEYYRNVPVSSKSVLARIRRWSYGD
ncbi:hypothetical protein HID58_046475 [Brassica napus]|uniref:RAB6-interacting golgin n=1 Tax=Brassica napus TaxID=3708 RepID=A0ABQ8AWN7_BRANA|nr:hypothetical protein HID58_046475 [Brassica napus]